MLPPRLAGPGPARPRPPTVSAACSSTNTAAQPDAAASACQAWRRSARRGELAPKRCTKADSSTSSTGAPAPGCGQGLQQPALAFGLGRGAQLEQRDAPGAVGRRLGRRLLAAIGHGGRDVQPHARRRARAPTARAVQPAPRRRARAHAATRAAACCRRAAGAAAAGNRARPAAAADSPAASARASRPTAPAAAAAARTSSSKLQGVEVDPRCAAAPPRLRQAQRLQRGDVGQGLARQGQRRRQQRGQQRMHAAGIEEGAFPADAVVEHQAAQVHAGQQAQAMRGRAEVQHRGEARAVQRPAAGAPSRWRTATRLRRCRRPAARRARASAATPKPARAAAAPARPGAAAGRAASAA